MDRRQLAAILRQTELIDRGASAPRLSGPYGLYLRGYQRERTDLVDLAVAHHLDVRRDGAVSGDVIGPVELSIVDAESGCGEHTTDWGEVALCLALCPELMEMVSIRLWLTSASARDVYRRILLGHAGLRLTGTYRWLPPGVITPGTANIENQRSTEDWSEVPYLKATGDDVVDLPHALDYRFLLLQGQMRMAHFRTIVLAQHNGGGVFIVPSALRSQPTSVEVSDQHCSLFERREGPWLVLAYLEPGESTWHVWKARSIDGETALRHSVLWVAHRRGLAGMVLTDDAVAACRHGLETAGLHAASSAFPQLRGLSLLNANASAFAKAAAARLLLGPRTV